MTCEATAFRCGHPRSPDNTLWERDSRRRAGGYARCLACRRASHRRYRNSPRGRETRLQYLARPDVWLKEFYRKRDQTVNGYLQRWREANREHIRAYKRAWRARRKAYLQEALDVSND